MQAALQSRMRVEVRARLLGDQWFGGLTGDSRDEIVVFLLLTSPLPNDWETMVSNWLGPRHTLYTICTDSVPRAHIRALDAMTAAQPVPRAAHRIAQPDHKGLDKAIQWIIGILDKLFESMEIAPPPPSIKTGAARWRHLASNPGDPHFYPEEYATSMQGVGKYRLVAASRRGKTHAHQGTFREDATALAVSTHWNIIAVADGAGTAPLARIGSNLAVKSATSAIYDAQPPNPSTEDVGRAIWAGLTAAYQSLQTFAEQNRANLSDLSTTLQLLIHWPMGEGCLLGIAHIGDGIVTAETPDGRYYLLTDPDTDPDDASRTLFLTSGSLKKWMRERTKVYQFDEPLDIVALMTDGVSGDLEPYADLLHTNLFERLHHRVLCYPLPQQEQALLAMISYDLRGSFDDRTLAVLSRG